ncbi:hypothetical protein MIND_00033200 [Mycena indigotica]|uniref:Uncharacterized protein n=1 Tax=Mycena indigotica TaxID=2126181 RepID=A0A8H6TCI9_9AGAR|nr:uncharacterized protein MIND_00033200 [Mycena indigotica]KAF7315188.1 hypothetical protein MIND_00033200 [Mycena indigotica]
MAPKYLCCLPLRLGVLIISFLEFLSSALVSGVMIALLIFDAQDKSRWTVGDTTVDVQLSGRYKYIALAIAVIYAFVAIISLLGFIGAIRKKESMVRIFSTLCKISLVCQIAVTLAAIILSIVDRSQLKKLCVGSSTTQAVIDACDNFANRRVWEMILGSVLPILFQAYGVYIIAAYARKLRSEQNSIPGYRSGPAYVKVQGEEAHPLTQSAFPPAGYSDASHKV